MKRLAALRIPCRLRMLALLMAAATAASVCGDESLRGYYGYGFPWFGYGNNGPAAYALGNIPAPPYFALHPPVYYSHPVARPYGHSPFACPCGVGEHGRRPPRVVANPFIEWKRVEPADPAKTPPETKPAAKVAAVPVRIVNPYFDSGTSAEPSLVSN